MRKTKLWLVALFLVFLSTAPALAQKKLSAAEAKDHVGETATVCGTVASAKYAAGSRGQPTFLNLDEPYPNQIFTVVIWREDRAKFGRPEDKYLGKRICVKGKIESYRGTPEIVAREAAQIQPQ
jgi:DNA/RNA endonuclease YhcR with UshA esterase domain